MAGNEDKSGYKIVIHRSLIEPILMAGVPRGFCIINWTIAAALVIGLHMWYFLPVNIIIHAIGAMLVKKDRDFFKILSRHLKYKKYYRT